jgi:membrane protease YdiL (CAAX protease family)
MKKLAELFYYEKSDLKTYILLLSAPLLLSLYRYHGYAEYFGSYFSNLTSNPLFDLYAHFWQFFIFALLMLVIPLIVIKFVFKEPLKNYALVFGDVKNGLIIALSVIVVFIIPISYFGAQMADVRLEYPLAKTLLEHHELIFLYEAIYVIFYYIAWEFFFRGFLLFGLKDRFGAFSAILIQTISSCLVHIGKPEGEIMGSIAFGIILGVIALRTKSIWYVFLIHAAMGVLTDLFILYL